MRCFLFFSVILSLFSVVFLQSTTVSSPPPEIIEMSGDSKSVVSLLQQIMEASQRQNINQQFRVRTVDGNIIMESVDYKPGELENLN